jgi:hypothetical protein
MPNPTLRTRVFFLVLSISIVASAQASEAPLTDVSSIKAPVIRSQPDVPYPPDAHGDAEVVLELVIGSAGEVREARVIDGVEPFAEAARAQALTWSFDPATRGGQPLSARIRFVVTFREPAPSEPPPETTSAPPSPSRASTPAPVDVTVRGQRNERVVSLGRSEVRQLPGAFGDPFRAVEALPGVTPITSGLPYFYVRGAPPGNVGYYFDGVRVPLLFHAAAGPSVIHPGFVDEVKLYPGGYPARFGRFAGGIVAADSVAPENRLHGEASLRLVDAGGMLEVPFAEGRGNVMVAGRYSYSAAVVSQIVPTLDLGYWDYQARALYDVTPNDRVGVFAFGAFDFASQEDNGTKQTLYDTRFHRLDLRYDRRLFDAGRLRIAATLGDDRTTGQDDAFTVRDRMLGARLEYTTRLGDDAELKAGADVTSDRYAFDLSANGPGDVPNLVPHEDLTFGARADVAWKVDPRVTVIPGFRADVYRADGTTVVAPEPRVSARFRASDDVVLFHDLGVAHQLPSYVAPIPGFAPSLGNGLQLGLQTAAGVEVKLPYETTGSVTLFQNALLNGTDRLGIAQAREIDPTLQEDERSLGQTAGAELLVKRKLSQRLGGFVAYTLSRSRRYLQRMEGPGSVDRTHVLNVAMAYDLGRGWRIGARAVYYTGVPAKVAYLAAARSPPRTTPYYRFDWRLEKRWTIGQSGAWWSLVIEFLNTTLHKEAVRKSCNAFYCREATVGPVTVPSIGVEASF